MEQEVAWEAAAARLQASKVQSLAIHCILFIVADCIWCMYQYRVHVTFWHLVHVPDTIRTRHALMVHVPDTTHALIRACLDVLACLACKFQSA